MEKAIVLASGGINSTVALAAAREQFQVALLHVAWGHRAAGRERAAFDYLAGHYKIKQTLVIEIDELAGLGGNARVSKRHLTEHTTTASNEAAPTFVPGLLPTMLNIAVDWAASTKINHIICGLSENHGLTGPTMQQLYPDHRQEFIQSFNLMLHYAMPGDSMIEVAAPILNLSRDEIIRLGRQMKIPFNKTWTCLASDDKPCHRCLPCLSRAEGFIQSGIPDPLELELSIA